MFRRRAIIGRDNQRLGHFTKNACAAIIDIKVGDDPAAAVNEEDDRERSVANWGINARVDVAIRTRDFGVFVLAGKSRRFLPSFSMTALAAADMEGARRATVGVALSSGKGLISL